MRRRQAHLVVRLHAEHRCLLHGVGEVVEGDEHVGGEPRQIPLGRDGGGLRKVLGAVAAGVLGDRGREAVLAVRRKHVHEDREDAAEQLLRVKLVLHSVGASVCGAACTARGPTAADAWWADVAHGLDNERVLADAVNCVADVALPASIPVSSVPLEVEHGRVFSGTHGWDEGTRGAQTVATGLQLAVSYE